MDPPKPVRVSVRTDKQTKVAATKVLSAMGFDMSTAINVFLKQVIHDQRLPFTPNAESSIDFATDIALRQVADGDVKSYQSLDDFRRDLYHED